MKVAKTIEHKILNHSRIFDATVELYNEALSYLIEVIDQEITDTSLYTTKDMTTLIEGLVHRTRDNPSPKYKNFDTKFYKFPSYLRRSAISAAFGKVQSFRSLYDNWLLEKEMAEQAGRAFRKRPPSKQFVHKEFPVLYKGNMFIREDACHGKVKAFVQNDWVWVDVTFRPQDLARRGVLDWKECNPKLVRCGKKYFLHISYEQKVKLTTTPADKQKICAVDLGLTNSAVCSIMDANGTVLARRFINQAREKDQLRQMTGKLRKAQRQSGYVSAPRYWNRINGLQKEILHVTASQIVQFAQEYNVDTIVFEHLGKMKVPKGTYGAKRLRFKLHYWRRIGIQNKVKEMAHHRGMRFSRINPRNTSKLAFDGSGEVKRNRKKDLVTFANGKVYHADLSASYNIGARFFLRAIQKSMSEKAWLQLTAKVPSIAIRNQWTLASFIALRTVHSSL